jgi:hypothetical protein
MLRIPGKNPAKGVAVAAAAAAVVTCTASASAASPAATPDQARCVVFDHLIERAEVHVNPLAGGAAAVGTSVGEFRTASGRLIATEDGSFVAYQNADGSRSELFQYTGTLAGSTIFGSGTVSIDAITAGQAASLYAVGTSGWLRGLTGNWTFRLTGAPAPGVTVFDASFTLCR